jgi:LPXTG-motif cell wall-anchored protein
MTFSAPVQIPGVTLNAGTYRFRLANPETSRNVLQVLSNDGSIVYAMFHTMYDSRTSVTEDPVVTFRETPAGVPPAVRTLFYGGEHRGYEFVYPKGEPIMIAEVVPQSEITYTPYPATPAAERVIEPESALEPIAEAVPEAEPLAQPEAVELPRTASPMPLLATGGLASLLLGLALSVLRRRAS